MPDETNSLFDRIVAALGGTSAAARALGCRPSQICQWRARDGKFPNKMFFVVQAAVKPLRRQRKNKPDIPPELPRELFKFKDERRAG